MKIRNRQKRFWIFYFIWNVSVLQLTEGGLKSTNYAFMAQRSLAERARGLELHSCTDARIGSGATSL